MLHKHITPIKTLLVLLLDYKCTSVFKKLYHLFALTEISGVSSRVQRTPFSVSQSSPIEQLIKGMVLMKTSYQLLLWLSQSTSEKLEVLIDSQAWAVSKSSTHLFNIYNFLLFTSVIM